MQAAQSYLYLVRNASDARLKEQLRTQSAKVLDRADRIKKAKKAEIRPVGVDRLSLGELLAEAGMSPSHAVLIWS